MRPLGGGVHGAIANDHVIGRTHRHRPPELPSGIGVVRTGCVEPAPRGVRENVGIAGGGRCSAAPPGATICTCTRAVDDRPGEKPLVDGLVEGLNVPGLQPSPKSQPAHPHCLCGVRCPGRGWARGVTTPSPGGAESRPRSDCEARVQSHEIRDCVGQANVQRPRARLPPSKAQIQIARRSGRSDARTQHPVRAALRFRNDRARAAPVTSP